MKTLVLKNIVKNSSSNEEGMILFDYLKKTYLSNDSFVLQIDSDLSLSSSFLNSSIGLFLDKYGYENLKKMMKIKGSKTQFLRILNYINKYNKVYSD